jgi:hypothetical protein
MHLPKLTDALLSSSERLNRLERIAEHNQASLHQIAKTVRANAHGRRWSLGLGIVGLTAAGLGGVMAPAALLAYWPIGLAIFSVALILRR